MSLPEKELFEFDSFRLDPAEQLLLRDGEPISLEPKVLETLLVLVRHGGRLVSKEELMQAVWPDSFVEESNLTRNISVLRKALQENGGPQYIETVPKRGYRFVGKVRALSGEQTELIVQTAKVSVVVEEEESDGATEWQGERAMEPVVALTGKPSFFGKLKDYRLGVALALLLAAGAAAGYFNRSRQTIDSLAVLPFVNVGAQPDSEYLAEGVTDGLISGLARLPQLKVMSRNAVWRYKGKEADAQQAGAALGVRAVLIGKVTQRGADLLISTELVDVRDNRQLWGGQYNRKLSDLPAVQAELARDIAEKLRLRLSGEDKQRVTKRRTENAEAYELYLKGRFYNNTLDREKEEKALEYFQRAIAKDPRFALPYAELAGNYVGMASVGTTYTVSPQEALQKAKEAAAKAIALDDTLAEAHLSLAEIARVFDWDWNTAEREYRRAIELTPNVAAPHHFYAHHLVSLGRFDEALAESLRALALDPLNVGMNFHLGWHYFSTRQYEQAAPQLQKTLSLDPNHSGAHGILGQVYGQQGRYPEAVAEFRRCEELKGRDVRGNLGHVYALAGQRNEAQKLLAQLQEEAKHKPVSSYNIAKIYAGLGEPEQVLVWLEKAVAERDGNLTDPGLKVDVIFEQLHADARFAELLRRMGLAQ